MSIVTVVVGGSQPIAGQPVSALTSIGLERNVGVIEIVAQEAGADVRRPDDGGGRQPERVIRGAAGQLSRFVTAEGLHLAMPSPIDGLNFASMQTAF